MRRANRSWIRLIVALVLSGPRLADAKDYCLRLNGVADLVGKNFSLPAKGKCKPFNGFAQGEFTSAPFFSGDVCTSSDGSTAHFNLLSTNSLGIEGLNLSLNVATKTGSGQECIADTGAGGSCGAVSVAPADCNPNPVPVP